MSRKDYRVIAETIRLLPTFETDNPNDRSALEVVRFSAVVERFIKALRHTTPRFNESKFRSACYGRNERNSTPVMPRIA